MASEGLLVAAPGRADVARDGLRGGTEGTRSERGGIERVRVEDEYMSVSLNCQLSGCAGRIIVDPSLGTVGERETMTFGRTDDARERGTRAASSTPDRPRAETPVTRERRAFLRATGALAFAGPLAGCASDGNGGGDDGGDADGGGGTGSVDDWLSDTGNYDSVEDLTGESAVTVEVGARGNNGPNAFAPAAISIASGTTVTWEWVNGYHNVVAVDGQFDSGDPEQSATFRHAFESPGTFLYYCDPHRSIGMKGAVVVAESEGEGGEVGERGESASGGAESR